MLTSASVKAKALELGFDACGVAAVQDWPELGFLREWLARGYAGEMAYLARSAGRRADARHVVPSARAVVATATIYNVDRPYSVECADRGRAQLARYAWGDDYHDVVGERLSALLAWMREASPEPFDARAYVDTGPVQERVYAQYAGLGWIGRNTCLIGQTLGSWTFLGEILAAFPLEPDVPAIDQCGTCTLCLDACPTGALVEPGVLDATRCISYLTIELRGGIPEALRPAVGSHVYGCDICQEVCPWNQMAPRSEAAAWQPRAAWDGARLVWLAQMTDAQLAETVRDSAMRRASLPALRRSTAVALGNTGSADARRALECRPADSPSFEVAMVQEHTAWALTRLDGAGTSPAPDTGPASPDALSSS